MLCGDVGLQKAELSGEIPLELGQSPTVVLVLRWEGASYRKEGHLKIVAGII